MGMKVLNGRVKLRHDTESSWSSKNPVLLSGEMAISTDKNNRIKVGDGTKTWSQLEYAGFKVGNNLTVNGETISLTKSNVTSALGYTPPTTNTTYDGATTSSDGLMSAADKIKLNGIETGANNYTLPTASTSAKGGITLDGSTSKYLRGDGTWETPPDNNTTYASLKNPNAITVKVYSGSSTPANTTYDGSATAAPEVAGKGAFTGVSVSGKTVTFTKADGGTTAITTQDSNTTYDNVSTSAAGLAPKVTDTSKYLKGDGSWATPTNTTYANAATNTAGLMSADDKVKLNGIATNANNYSLPDASTSAKGGITLDGSTSKYLRGDGTWQTPPDNNTTYASLKNPNAMTYKVYSGTATSEDTSYDGSSTKSIEVASKDAIVGITRSGTTFTMTKADGSTDTFTQQDSNTTYANAATNAAGLMSADDKVKLNGIAANANNYTLPAASTSAKGGIQLDGSTSKYLRGDGSWETPPDNNTTYANVSTSGAGLAPKVTSTSGFLKGDGTWATPTNTTYANAATNAAGLMSADDKVKLNGIATNANNYTLPEASTTEPGGIQLEGSSTKYFRADGTWNTPTNTTYASLKNPNPITVKVYSGTSTPADTTYDGSATAAPEVAGKGAFTGVSVSGKTVTFTKADGGTTAITTQDNNTTYANVSTSAAGLAPKVTDTSKYLKGDGTWSTPANTTYADFTAASASANGVHGLVPAPTSGNQSKFLRGDATWATPTNTTYANAATNAAGLMSADDKVKLNGIAANANNYSLPDASTSAKGGIKLDGSTSKYLRGDGTWQTPPDNNTTYASLKNPNAITVKVYSGTSTSSDTGYDGSSTKSVEVAGKGAFTGVSRSGTTFTFTKADGSTTTVTQQDSNTTYAVVSSSANGLAPMLPNIANQVLHGNGTWGYISIGFGSTTSSLANAGSDIMLIQ